jgi:RHS repeat-associated protein
LANPTTFTKGKLTKVSNAISETKYLEFDNLGRVKSSQQITDGTAYNPMTYTYNLSGALIEQKYPSGKIVRNFLDNDGDLSRVTRQGKTFASNFSFTASGAVSSMKMGNGNWESTQFNSRLQPIQMALGNAPNETNLWKVNFDYGLADNNGNVKSQTITVPNVAQPFVQTYTYDSLNRLKSANETIGGNQTWKQTYNFDKYGNRRFDTTNNNTTTLQVGSVPKVVNPEALTSNNRLKADQDNDGIADYLYDASGNITQDAQNNRFVYDAENKQSKYFKPTNTTNEPDAIYSFDGDGKRVKKELKNGLVVIEIVIFVYDANSRMIAEFSTNPVPQNEAQTSYLTNDTLGSPRVITNQNGQVTSRRDFLPYGEDLYTAQRTTQLGYNNDNVKERFTGYARDQESGLEYAQARMYSASLGRFTGCDPIYTSKEHTVNPQRWNLYVYVVNNPIVLTDPDGKKPKRVIDVFIVFNKGERTRNKNPNWDKLKKEAPKGTKINVYYSDNELSGEKIMNSLQQKGRSVIIITHSTALTSGEGIKVGEKIVDNSVRGIKTAMYQSIGTNGLSTVPVSKDANDNFIGVNVGLKGASLEETKPILTINAKNLLIFSCHPGKDFSKFVSSNLGSDNSAAYFNNPDKPPFETSIRTLLKAGYVATQTLSQTNSSEKAVDAANQVLSEDEFPSDSRMENIKTTFEVTVDIRVKKPN